jgi:hypothetical protein
LFNLLISYNPTSWDNGSFELERSRVAIEYTADEISERYKFLDERAISELKNFPALFVTENETTESRIGYITDIRLRQTSVVFDFAFDPIFPKLPIGSIEALRGELGLGSWELSRTHWAIKDEQLFEILVRKGYITPEQLKASEAVIRFCNQDDIKITAFVADTARHDWATTRDRPYDWCHLDCNTE